MIGKETFHKISYVFLTLFFTLSPFSISLCQIFAGLSIFFLFLDHLQKRNFPKFPLALIFWIGLYLSFLITPIWENHTIDWKRDIVKSEFGDLWMGFLLLHQPYLTNWEKKRLKKAVLLGAIFLILSGLLSLFSPYRLAPYVMDGFRYLEGKRLPHIMSIFHGISLYLPIGFQSTHLTYGGLIAIYLPPLWEITFRLFQRKNITKRYWKISYLYFLISSLGFILLFLNQSRSVWIGLIIGSLFLFLRQKHSFKSILPRLLAFAFLILVIFTIVYMTNWLFQRAIDDIFAKRSLENQRIWIHKMNFSILKENFLFGIGAGNYGNKFIESAIPIVNNFPELYYDLYITPKSHAHFDFLHDLILGGVFACVFFSSFLWVTFQQIFSTKHLFVFYLGIFVIVIAGSFQCFLLDDEVLLPFMGILTLLPSRKNQNHKIQIENGKNHFPNHLWRYSFEKANLPFGIILLWILTSLMTTFLWSRTENKDLVLHRTRTKDNFPSPLSQLSIGAAKPVPLPQNTKDWYFKLSGCLDKEVNFRTDSKIRKKPIQLKLIWDSDFQEHFPNSIRVEIRKRESFDQDKEYKVHGERILKTISLPITGKDILVSVDPSDQLQKEPEFVDFGFWYEWEGNTAHLPRIQILGNCD
ncbi:O-antigen ligase family protein [Leptospira sp. WS39.C2]